MNPTGRIHFLDNLRAFVIILVIVLHASMTYMAYAPEWWYVVDSQSSLFFTALVLLIDVPIMLILFFTAGYFAFPSLVKRGPGQFLQSKFIRVGLPWLFGVLVLAPPTAYMIYFSRDVPVSLSEFWASDFWGVMYQQSVYWFLGILFLLFALLSLVYRLSPWLRNLQRQPAAPTWRLFAGFGLYATLSFVTLNLFFPLDTWTHAGYIFMFQPLRVPLYLGYFILGMYAYQRGWFTDQGYSPRLWVWSSLFIVGGLLYVGYRFTIPAPAQTTLLLKAGNALLFNIFSLASLMTGLAFFKRYVNSDSFFWSSQAQNSYAIYYVHPLFLYPLALLFTSISLSIFIKVVVLIGLVLLFSWGFSALVLKRAPLVRQAF